MDIGQVRIVSDGEYCHSYVEALQPDGEWLKLRGVNRVDITIEHGLPIRATLVIHHLHMDIEAEANAVDSGCPE